MEEKKERAKKSNFEDKSSKTDQSIAQETCFRNESDLYLVLDKSEAAIRDLNKSIDLDIGLKGHDGSVRSIKDGDWVKAGFAC